MSNALLLRTLYRSLLRSAKPFSSPSENAVVLSCLLHRTGMDDGLVLADALPSATPSSGKDEKIKGPHQPRSIEEARDLSRSYVQVEDDDDEIMSSPLSAFEERHDPSHVLFRRLLREVVTGTTGSRQMQFPCDMDTSLLQEVIRREFRSTSSPFDETTRIQVGFFALRELSKKLSWADKLSTNMEETTEEERELRNRRQAARKVTPLPPNDPASFLKAGTYLVAHPLLTGFFRRTVICILDHTDASRSRTGGTYGLIVNRIAVSPASGKRRTLKDVLQSLPPELTQAFGNCSVREGGPVHMSLQMIHARTPDQPALGGTVLSMVAAGEDETESTALDTDRAIYYQGNMMDAADAVITGALDRDDVSFYVGASCWEVGQLEGEIDRGYFIPCAGPPDIALTGMCERVGDDDKNNRLKPDLWLSMMCALGQDEANLAHLVSNDEIEYSGLGEACDMF